MGVFETVRSFTRQHDLIPEDEAVVAAVSGGADSRCMLDCLSRMGVKLVVAHLDHGLRPESAREVEFVRQIAMGYGHRFVTERWHAPAGDSGVEQAARWARYRFLVRVAIEAGASRVATGHTLSDQAETIVLHLVRGAGLEGLTGMEPSTRLGDWQELENADGLYLVRPLLKIGHAEAVAYCRGRGLKWLEDPTNLDPEYTRNLIRLRVIPLLEQINPQAEESLARAGESLKPVRELLEGLGLIAWGAAVARIEQDRVVFIREEFLEQPDALRIWLVRRASESLSPGIEISYETSLELARAVSEAGYKPAQLPRGIEVVQAPAGPALTLVGSKSYLDGYPQLDPNLPGELEIPGEVTMKGGWKISSRAVEDGELAAEDFPGLENKWRVVLELPSDGKLRVRSYEPGDRIQPMGMEGRVKVGDLFTNEKVPVAARPAWPVVTTASGEVIWVAGLRLAHPFRVKPRSERLVHLEVLPPE